MLLPVKIELRKYWWTYVSWIVIYLLFLLFVRTLVEIFWISIDNVALFFQYIISSLLLEFLDCINPNSKWNLFNRIVLRSKYIAFLLRVRNSFNFFLLENMDLFLQVFYLRVINQVLVNIILPYLIQLLRTLYDSTV